MLQAIKDFGNKIQALSGLILLVISGILASLLYVEEKKNASNEELLKNDKVNDEVQKLDTQVAADDANIKSEEDVRKVLEENLKKESNENNDDQSIANDIANRK